MSKYMLLQITPPPPHIKCINKDKESKNETKLVECLQYSPCSCDGHMDAFPDLRKSDRPQLGKGNSRPRPFL